MERKQQEERRKEEEKRKAERVARLKAEEEQAACAKKDMEERMRKMEEVGFVVPALIGQENDKQSSIFLMKYDWLEDRKASLMLYSPFIDYFFAGYSAFFLFYVIMFHQNGDVNQFYVDI